MTNFAILFTRETMKVLDAYQIPIISLEDKSYRYSFEGGDDFFKAFEQEWVQKGKFQAEIELNKSATMIQVLMKIKGHLNLICDRSNEEFEFPLDIQEKLIYKYGDHFEDLGDNLFLIDRKEPKLDLSQDLYDFIALQVPMKKLHPRFVKPEDESAENEFLYTTAKDTDIPKTEEESIDPRWAALKKLTDNN
ncbi:YceD family protein [Aquirufa nivalisilvae]|jgi:uncharacterized metal-binding protein YceD (DUF177 family)|nr:DUF177 domain-containing protein [Aquirufa nivalisilvae]MCZ2478964.1 DUF177 domain-containing protein [Aquirufa nivalisilvae]TBH75894.1 DUF177 domain-containing protein [Aquirufa nivalisilvae]